MATAGYRSRTERPSFSISSLTASLDPVIQKHLRRVYTNLLLVTLSCAAGALAQLYTGWGYGSPFLGALVSVAVTIAFSVLPKHHPWRFRVFLLCGASNGFNIGPLLRLAGEVSPVLPLIAFLGAASIFACLSITAVFARRRSYLFLGGGLSAALLSFAVISFIGIFTRSTMYHTGAFYLQLYGGLLMFALFVLYDTQLIIEKAHIGERDDVNHAYELFLDLLNIFVRILIAMIRNRKEEERKKRDN